MRRLTLVLAMTLLAACFGTDDDDDSGPSGGGSGGGGTSDLAQNCYGRCEARANDCQAPSGIISSTCNDMCSKNVTETQAQCMEGKSCNELESMFGSGQYPCGIGSTGTGGSGQGTGGSGQGTGGGSSSGTKTLGQSCDCPAEGGWASCKGDGAPCRPELTCVEFADKKMCTEECEVDSCSGGLECTELNVSGADMGNWCW